MQRRRVLLIEDEESISEPLSDALSREGFDVAVAATAADGRAAFQSGLPDFVLLDVMLPDGDGRDLLREIRSTSRVPADDYVTKPFSAAELVARMRAVLRRAAVPPSDEGPTLEAGDVSMDLQRRQVTRAGEEVELTVKEFELLRVLLENAGKLVRRKTLMDEVWDPGWWGSTKTLDVHISALRRKLGDKPSEPRYIHTVRGVGFRFASPDELET